MSMEQCFDFEKVISCCFFATRSEILNLLVECCGGMSGLVFYDSEVCCTSEIC